MTLQLLHFVKISQIKNPMIYLFEISCPIKSPIISLSSFPVRSEIICYRYDNTARRTNFQPVCVCVSLANGSNSIRQTAYAVNGCINVCRPAVGVNFHRFDISTIPSPRRSSSRWPRSRIDATEWKMASLFNEYLILHFPSMKSWNLVRIPGSSCVYV